LEFNSYLTWEKKAHLPLVPEKRGKKTCSKKKKVAMWQMKRKTQKLGELHASTEERPERTIKESPTFWREKILQEAFLVILKDIPEKKTGTKENWEVVFIA